MAVKWSQREIVWMKVNYSLLTKLWPFSTAGEEYTLHVQNTQSNTCINSATKSLLWAGLSEERNQLLTHAKHQLPTQPQMSKQPQMSSKPLITGEWLKATIATYLNALECLREGERCEFTLMLISIALSHILVHLLKPNYDPSFSIWLQISLYWRTIVLKYLHVHGYYRVNKLMYNSRPLHLNPACSLPLTELLSSSWVQSQTHRISTYGVPVWAIFSNNCNKRRDLEYTLCGIFYTRQNNNETK